MLERNRRMKEYLRIHGIEATPKYIETGSLKGTWRFYNKQTKWTIELGHKFEEIGFLDFDGRQFQPFAGNGGLLMIFATLNPNKFNYHIYNQITV